MITYKLYDDPPRHGCMFFDSIEERQHFFEYVITFNSPDPPPTEVWTSKKELSASSGRMNVWISIIEEFNRIFYGDS